MRISARIFARGAVDGVVPKHGEFGKAGQAVDQVDLDAVGGNAADVHFGFFAGKQRILGQTGRDILDEGHDLFLRAAVDELSALTYKMTEHLYAALGGENAE